MSTRCMVQVDNHGEIINLYHHHDGYFMGVGLEIVLKLLDWDYEGEPFNWSLFDHQLPKVYENVDHSPEDQSDLEYIYTLELSSKGITFKGYERLIMENQVSNWKEWKSHVIFKSIIRGDTEKHNIPTRISLYESVSW